MELTTSPCSPVRLLRTLMTRSSPWTSRRDRRVWGAPSEDSYRNSSWYSPSHEAWLEGAAAAERSLARILFELAEERGLGPHWAASFFPA